jgi:hypothetical protein
VNVFKLAGKLADSVGLIFSARVLKALESEKISALSLSLEDITGWQCK